MDIWGVKLPQEKDYICLLFQGKRMQEAVPVDCRPDFCGRCFLFFKKRKCDRIHLLLSPKGFCLQWKISLAEHEEGQHDGRQSDYRYSRQGISAGGL